MSKLVEIFKAMFNRQTPVEHHHYQERAEALVLAYQRMMDEEISQDEFFTRLAEVVESEEGGTIIALIEIIESTRDAFNASMEN